MHELQRGQMVQMMERHRGERGCRWGLASVIGES